MSTEGVSDGWTCPELSRYRSSVTSYLKRKKIITTPSIQPPHTIDVSHDKSSIYVSIKPTISYEDYVARFQKFGKASAQVYILMVALLDRWVKQTGKTITTNNMFRLTLAAHVLAIKMHDDAFYSDIYYAKVGGVSPSDLVALQVSFMMDLRWQLWVSESDYKTYEAEVLNSTSTSTTSTSLREVGMTPHPPPRSRRSSLDPTLSHNATPHHHLPPQTATITPRLPAVLPAKQQRSRQQSTYVDSKAKRKWNGVTVRRISSTPTPSFPNIG